MIYNILCIAIGFAALIVGADLLVKGSSGIAKKFYIPEIIIGLTIVCVGTSLPELMITVNSAIKGHTDLIISNAIGSNICNILLILGFVSIINPMKIEEDVKNIHIPISIIATLLVLLMGNGLFGYSQQNIERKEGIFLLCCFAIYFTYPLVIAIRDIVKSKDVKKDLKKRKKISIVTCVILIIIGAVLLKFGGDLVVDYSVIIASTFGISESIIGLTIVAVGTALPELVTSIVATMTKDTDIAIGNLVGSSILNICLILGLGASISPLPFYSYIYYIFIVSTLSLFLLWTFCHTGKDKNCISRVEGIIMFSLYILYTIKLFV